MSRSTAATLSAQTPSSGLFADGGAVADFDPLAFPRSPGTRPAVTAGIGAPFAGRWRVGFEFTLPSAHEDDVSLRYSQSSCCSSGPIGQEGTRDHRLITST